MARRPLITAALCLLTVLPSALAAGAPESRLSGLLANPPFGLSRAGAAGAPTDPIEFRAVLEDNGNKIFSIYDNTTHQSHWVDLNDPVKDFSVKEFDAATNSVTVEYQGRPMKLALKRAAPVVAAAPLPLPGNLAPPAGRNNPPVVQTPVPPQQMQQIRDEINRRRALRAQPVTPAGTGSATATTLPAPPPRP